MSRKHVRSFKRRRHGANEDISIDCQVPHALIEFLYEIYFFYNKDKTIMQIISNIMSKDFAHKITKTIISIDPMQFKKENAYRDIYELVRGCSGKYTVFYELSNSYSIDENKIKNIYESNINNYLDSIKSYSNPFENKAQFFQKRFNLSDIEKDLLSIIFIYFSMQASSNIPSDIFANISTFFRFLSHLLISPLSNIMSMLSLSGNLVKYGIIEKIYTNHSCIEVDLPSIIEDYVNGVYSENDIIDKCYKTIHDPVIPLKSFLIPGEKKEIILKLLQSSSSTSLLFYGKPGTGKTELAKTISNTAGLNAYFLKTDDFEKRNSFKSRLNLAMSFLSKTDVLIIDECDNFLNTEFFSFFGPKTDDKQKSEVNNILDSHKIKTIWITNRYTEIAESTKRRFSFSMKFSKFTNIQRKQIWHTICDKHNVKYLNNKTIEHFARIYDLSTGSIDFAVKNALMLCDSNKSAFVNYLDEFLNNHNILINNHDSNKKLLNTISQNYCLNYINSDLNLENVIESCSVIKDKLDSNEEASAKIMLYGLPGTGKTEFVKHLSYVLEMDLSYKRYSDLQSQYVGVAEKQFAHAFNEASHNNSILFIDEADSFFRDRSIAKESWLISQTNELLTQLENFNGIFVCATNLVELLDTAALRRFNFKIEFLPLQKHNIVPLFKKYFSVYNGRLFPTLRKKLEEIEGITFGDFKAVLEKIKFIKKDVINYESIINDLVKEAEYKNMKKKKTVGFMS